MKTIFVYGTLKQGRGNNYLLRHSEFLGKASTAPAYRLSGGGIPFLWHGSARVIGELYRVDDVTLQSVDRLEGHPDWYRRQPVVIEGREEEDIEAYFCPVDRGVYEGDTHEFGKR